MVKDPICGMSVDVKKAKIKGLISRKKDKTYYFCSKNCKDEFEGKNAVTKNEVKTSKLGKEKISIKITGMSCVSCAGTIESSLKKVNGVNRAEINFAAEKAYIEYNPETTNRTELEDAIINAGYNIIKENGKSNILKYFSPKSESWRYGFSSSY